jgi:hypothetical protein
MTGMTELMTEQGMVRVPAGTWTVDPAHASVEHTGGPDGDEHDVEVMFDVSAVRAS